ncbi:hypothetical protein Gorai_022814, partial [Gossypium raimondii]|nr:hypothetical protein [Gossypium raimondii]
QISENLFTLDPFIGTVNGSCTGE